MKQQSRQSEGNFNLIHRIPSHAKNEARYHLNTGALMLTRTKRIAVGSAMAVSLLTGFGNVKTARAQDDGPLCELACLIFGTGLCCFYFPAFCTSACVVGGGACIEIICGVQ